MTDYCFSQLVLNWYHEHGRKDLPWQKNKTLYKIWISEIMLQQTTVKTVIPYFQKFLKKFPNIKILSSSTLDEVLYLWSGLGYYARAKNIYKTSQIISKKYKGKFPEEFSKIIELPGIGKSTAGAILSFSLNYFFPILDGNVRRVLIRYYGIQQEIKVREIQKKLWKIIEIKTPLYNTGKFNQAMIDIGSLICKPKIPLCKKCPINKKCVAHFQKKWSKYTFK
ncbi:MAG: A/G-specific adenine glycosylase, partial [Buchnera aphidicola]|nr:A/G-specific adenine glycosylase [Buchnera aphidicola]